jgi:hypothetical protein
MAAYRATVPAAAGDEAEAKKPDEPSKPDAKAKPDAKPDAKAEDDEPDAKGIAKVLRAREKANTEREEARKASDEAKAALAEAKAVREEAAKAATEAKAFLTLLRRDPIAAIREAGWHPDDLILNIRDAGTPGSQAQREALTMRQELAELREMLKQRVEQEEQAREEHRRQSAHVTQQETERGFLKVALDEAKYPALAKIYSKRPHLLVAEAARVADAYAQRTGQYATWEDIAEYLDSDHSDVTPADQQTGRRDASQAERAPGSRTLTADASSERRSAPVLEWDAMTDEQRRQAQIADMRAAIRAGR